MSRSSEYNKAYMRRYRQENRAREYQRNQLRHESKILPFAGVDGEGGNVPDTAALFGTAHEYFLLRAGGYTLRTGSPLTAFECLAFLADLPRDAVYVSYYFDYDVTMCIRGLPPERVRRILASGMTPTRMGEYELRYLPHKEFAVRRLPRDGSEPGPYTVINDVGPFFQCSFVAALEAWNIGTPEQRAAIAKGKLARGDFGELSQETDEYNALEIELLAELMERYREACEAAGYLPGKWQGPGWLATSMLRAHDCPKTRDLTAFSNVKLKALANDAYYGGRFEPPYVGPVPGPVYEYDINSAYPDAMRKLPCLACGTWVLRRKRPAAGTLWFGQMRFSHSPDSRLCHLPVRTKQGGLLWPYQGRGVYWSPEVEAAERAGTHVEVTEAYEYVPGKLCTHKPYDWIQGVYDYRKSLGKDAKGMVIKLAMNSIYGKKAQSIGMPAYANPIEAGLITAWTRAKIIDAYAAHPEAVVMIATDAVYSTVPLALPCSDRLGEWGEKIHDEGLFVIQSGVYFAGAGARNKTRGVAERVFSPKRAQFERAFTWLTYGFDETVTVQTRLFLNAKLAYAWNKPELAGQWFECEQDADHAGRRKPQVCTCRRVSFDWTAKRNPELYRRGAYFITRPKTGFFESVPYDKIIGGVRIEVRELRDLMEGQPDWNRGLATESSDEDHPDGGTIPGL